VARALVLSEGGDGGLGVERLAVPYDDAGFLADYARRSVPEGDYIRREFVRG